MKKAVVAVGMAAALGYAGWAAAASQQNKTVTAKETKEVSIGNAPEIIVESDAGHIECVAGAAGTVRVDSEKKAQSQEALNRMRVVIENGETTIRVIYRRAEGVTGNEHVALKISAPADAVLKLQTRGGHIQCSGFTRGAAVRTSGGHIAMKNVSGPLELNTSGGHIELDGVNGAVNARTSGGHIKTQGSLTGEITLSTGGGHIEAKGVDGTLRARTGGGHINVAGRLRGENILETGGGQVSVSLPADSNLAVRASTKAGKVSNDFDLSAEQKNGKTGGSLSGNIGSGADGSLTITSGAGAVSLRKS